MTDSRQPFSANPYSAGSRNARACTVVVSPELLISVRTNVSASTLSRA
jgi:hypothetical protein